MAKLAARRMIMQKLRRTPDQHSKALAQANAVRFATTPLLSLHSHPDAANAVVFSFWGA